MTCSSSCRVVTLAALVFWHGIPRPAAAQARDLGWSYSAELTAVWTGGNSESRTLGAGSSVRWVSEDHEVKVDAGGVRSDASIKTRRAVGTRDAHRIEEQSDSRKTAESWFARARYDRRIEDVLVGFGGVDWLRNTFAGIDGRLLIAAGLGYLWRETEGFRFKTDLAATYSFQEDVVDNPFLKSSFPGVRFSWDLKRTLTSTTRWESTLNSDVNVDETDDIRADLSNALALAISNRLALKPALRLLWRNRPSLTEVDLFTDAGAPSGDRVVVPLEKLDSFFTLAIVFSL